MTSMTMLIGRLVLAAFLIVGGLVCWSAAGIADDLATRHERIATLRYDTGEAGDIRDSWRALLMLAVDPDVIHHAATANYWQARYDALTADAGAVTDSDTDRLLMAANAAFRVSERDTQTSAMSVDRLDRALQGYAGVLKNGGFDRDAAYNYEYVARLRDSVARAKPTTRKAGGATSGLKSGSLEGGTFPPRATGVATESRGIPPRGGPHQILPTGPTIHGRPGRHPPPTRGEEFEVLTPMDFGDREAQPEATPGRRLPRKG